MKAGLDGGGNAWKAEPTRKWAWLVVEPECQGGEAGASERWS